MGKRKKHMKRKNILYELQESRNGGQIALTGFTYQFLYSCYLILSTYDANTFFYLEGIEDIDKITIENEFNNTTHIMFNLDLKKSTNTSYQSTSGGRSREPSLSLLRHQPSSLLQEQ